MLKRSIFSQYKPIHAAVGFCVMAFFFSSKLALACANEMGPLHEHHHALPYQKPGAPIRMRAPEINHLDLGQEMHLVFEFWSRGLITSVELELSADEALNVADRPVQRIPLNNGRFKVPVTVQANEEGRFYLNFFISAGGMSRSFSHGINVGDIKSIAQTTLEKSSAQVGGIKRMPARERIAQSSK